MQREAGGRSEGSGRTPEPEVGPRRALNALIQGSFFIKKKWATRANGNMWRNRRLGGQETEHFLGETPGAWLYLEVGTTAPKCERGKAGF